ncbi:ATP-binding cassette domain-containing protein [Congregibacter variabilis]|uniref:ATP-binding cassette domain-containing protein n=1 Tax=Congregibacter variabilis TaxID=3081200 RepID=A0ABZ0I0F7_9GAMM|nr:ATP-binding cassette domain-containing protein [Congregibacter sp. IMCC43200]
MPESPKDYLLCTQQLALSYRAKPALQGINWQWEQGDHWAILGANGAGKTALATIIAGEQTRYAGSLVRSDELSTGGTAYVCFERGRRLCERDQKLDCAEFESNARDIGTRVRDLLPTEGCSAQEWDQLVALLDMQDILDRGLRYISTGQMRKALLASALLSKPTLLILDSPLDGLDAATQQRLHEALNSIILQTPAVLTLCRSPQEIPDACNRLMLLERGRIVATGSPREVLSSPEGQKAMEAPPLDFGLPPAKPGLEAPDCVTATIELNNVSVSFGDLCVFRNLNWRMGPNQHSLIAGPNGCGKSTLLDLLTGDNHKAYGQDVSLFGKRRGSGESVWEIKARFGRVDARMQFAVPNGSSVEAVVLSGFFDSIGLRDRPSDQQRAAARHWLSALGLASERSREFHTLSFGLQRLVLLARAMVKEPAVLLLDEATLSLDPGHRRLLLDAVDHVVDEGRCQLLFVSHTAGELPRCINQLLQFEPKEDGSRILVSDL